MKPGPFPTRSSVNRTRRLPAAFLASAWCLPWAVLAGWAGNACGAWPPTRFAFASSPLFLLLERVFVWGLGLALAMEDAPLLAVLAVGCGVDLATMAFLHLPVQGSPLFWLIEAATLAICLVPAQLFARWTRENRLLAARNWMHVMFHSGLILGVWPLIAATLLGGDWSAWSARSSFANKLYLQILMIPAIFLAAAMLEFHSRGEGTPMPQDAPRKLVVSGIYAYVANPMQIGKFGVLAGWAWFWRSPAIALFALLGLLYSLTIARWREDRDMALRFGDAWHLYRQNVRRWLPRWRPWVAASEAPAILYLDLHCGPCSHVARWFAAQKPIALKICSLADFPGDSPARMTYRASGAIRTEQGIVAAARALEHIHFAWAFCGWMLQLPGIVWIAQLVGDAVSPREPTRCWAESSSSAAVVLSGKPESTR